MHETAENPTIDYLIGSKPKPEIMVKSIEETEQLPINPFQNKQVNQKPLVKEETEKKSIEDKPFENKSYENS